MIRTLAQAFVFVAAILIVYAEVQRFEAAEERVIEAMR
jgi:hypothetical protein